MVSSNRIIGYSERYYGLRNSGMVRLSGSQAEHLRTELDVVPSIVLDARRLSTEGLSLMGLYEQMFSKEGIKAGHLAERIAGKFERVIPTLTAHELKSSTGPDSSGSYYDSFRFVIDRHLRNLELGGSTRWIRLTPDDEPLRIAGKYEIEGELTMARTASIICSGVSCLGAVALLGSILSSHGFTDVAEYYFGALSVLCAAASVTCARFALLYHQMLRGSND